jgi:uncharacterized OB-fold protein
MTRPLPDTDDLEFAPFWAGAAAGELRLVFCSSCDRPRWPPRPVCAHCHGFEFTWRAVEPHGRLYTWTGVEHQTTRDLPPPYIVGLVEIADHPGVRLLGQVIGVHHEALRIDMPMVARFDVLTDGVTLVNWTPTDIDIEETRT